MNTMNMIFMMMMLTSASARMMDAPAPTAAIHQNHNTRVKFIKSCDTMKMSFLQYQDDVAQCGRMIWDGVVAGYSSDLSTIQPEIYSSIDISYFIMPMNYQDTYMILEGDIITDDNVEFMDTLKNFLERNTNAKSYCNRIAHTGGGNVYRITEGTKEVKICGSAIDNTPFPPPPSPPSPPSPPTPPSPPSSATTNMINKMFLAAIAGALFMI